MMGGKGKGALLVALLGKGKPVEEEKDTEEKSSEEMDEGEYDEAMKSGAEDLLKAIESKDASALARAFAAMHQVCSEGEE